MLNRSASLAMSTSILKALPGKLDIKRSSMYKRKNNASTYDSLECLILFLLQLNQTAGIFLALNSYHSQVYFKKTGR